MLTEKDPRLAGRVAFTHPNFVAYTFARFFIVIALEMQSVAVGWQVYAITNRAIDLGYVGLAQFLPGFALFLFAGHAADILDRRKLLMWCYAGYGVSSALLFAISRHATVSVHWIYAVLVLVGVVRSFSFPVSRAILPLLVPEEHFPNAVAWNASTFQVATIAGPALGGIVYAAFHGPETVYAFSVAVAVLSVALTLRIHPRKAAADERGGKTNNARRIREPFSLRTVLAGFRFILAEEADPGIDLARYVRRAPRRSCRASAHLCQDDSAHRTVGTRPAAQRACRGRGPDGNRGGALSHPAKGRDHDARCGGGLWRVHHRVRISRSLIVSLVALFLLGASDMVSVIIRGTLVQVATPDEMRGRVSAVDMLFIGVSNQLGEFESGLTAQWFGTVPAVVFGGVGTLLVIAAWAWLFPELRQADQLTVAELVPE